MTADTSVVVAALSQWHDQHEVSAAAIADIRALPAHVLLETYSVITRLPAGRRASPTQAASAIARRFPDPGLELTLMTSSQLPTSLAERGIFGGAVYDALVGLQAAHNHATLLTLDRRASAVYRALGVEFCIVEG
jgi:toxin FitB